MAFKSVFDAALGTIGHALEQSKQGETGVSVPARVALVPYFKDTVQAVHDVALREYPDPGTYRPLGGQFDTAAGVAEYIIHTAVMQALERQDPDAERILKRACDQWMKDIGRPVPKTVTRKPGDFDRCAALSFPTRYEF